MNGPSPRVLSEEWDPSTSSSGSSSRRKASSRVRFCRVASGLPLRPSQVVAVPFCPLLVPSSYGAVLTSDQLSPTQQVAQWLKRTTSFDADASSSSSSSPWSPTSACNPAPSAPAMPSFRTLVKRSRSRAEMPRSDNKVPEVVLHPPTIRKNGGSLSASEEELEKELLSDRPGEGGEAGSPLKRDPSSKSLYLGGGGKDYVSKSSVLSMRKCETVLALSKMDSAAPATQVSLLTSHSKHCRGNIHHSRLNLLQRLAHSGSKANLFGSRLSMLGLTSSSGDTHVLDDGFDSSAFGGLGPPQPLQAVNRLRVHATSKMCSRCSSRMSLASSKLSLGCPMEEEEDSVVACRICLMDVRTKDMLEIQACRCWFCKECLKSYIEFEIQQGAYDISCPDPQCEKQGVISLMEIENLVGSDLVSKYNRYRLSREVDLDACRTWCPRAGCETVCKLCPVERCTAQSVHCPTCANEFCSNCRKSWHGGITCEELLAKRKSKGKGLGKRSSKAKSKSSESEDEGIPEEDDDEDEGIPEDSESIKRCPACSVPIEKDAGCAQMMCKRCKHVFCWYCLESLDDDFLLRHYDKGPCKNKLGHSRASVLWHRTQVVGIFAGFGLLLLVASPLLLLAAPCILCCRCKVCSKLDEELEESIASQQSQPPISAS